MKVGSKEYHAARWLKWRNKNRPLVFKSCKKCRAQFQPKGKQFLCFDCKKTQCLFCKLEFIPKDGKKIQKFCCYRCKADSQRGSEPAWLSINRGKKPRTYHLTRRDKYGNSFDRDWRDSVFKRDNYTCQECKIRGGKLQAHHIKPWKEHPEARYNIKNGQTLCFSCHTKTETYGWSKYWHKKKIKQKGV